MVSVDLFTKQQIDQLRLVRREWSAHTKTHAPDVFSAMCPICQGYKAARFQLEAALKESKQWNKNLPMRR